MAWVSWGGTHLHVPAGCQSSVTLKSTGMACSAGLESLGALLSAQEQDVLLSWVALCFSTAQLMGLPHPKQVSAASITCDQAQAGVVSPIAGDPKSEEASINVCTQSWLTAASMIQLRMVLAVPLVALCCPQGSSSD